MQLYLGSDEQFISDILLWIYVYDEKLHVSLIP